MSRNALHRVLLIEDSQTDSMLFARHVKQMTGWEIVTVESLGAAKMIVSQPDRLSFDVVVVDLSLPDAIGMESVEFAHDYLPEAACVVLTGGDDEELAHQALRFHATDFLYKAEIARQGRMVRRALRYAFERNELIQRHLDAERNLRNAFQAVPVALVVVGEERRILYQNHGTTSFFGRNLSGDHPVLSWKAGDAPSECFTMVQTERGRVPVEVRSAPIKWSGQNARLFMLHDVSSEREVEKLRDEISTVQGRARAGVRSMEGLHDLRGRIQAMGELFKSYVGEDPHVKSMHSAYESFFEQYAKVREDARGVRVIRKGVEISALLRMCRKNLMDLERAAQVQLELITSTSASVMADAAALERAFNNILENGLDAVGRELNPRLSLEISEQDHEGRPFVLIAITDNGPGIADGTLKRIFEPHFTTKDKGTGLGLASSRSIVTAHGGWVEVESQKGQGTTFKIFLPVHQGEEATPGQKLALVIDDKRLMRKSMTRLLTSFDFEVHSFEGYDDAVKWLSTSTVDPSYIFCDCEMPPGPGGLDLYDWLKDNRPTCLSRFVLCSGDIDRSVGDRTIPLRLEKPVDESAMAKLLGPELV